MSKKGFGKFVLGGAIGAGLALMFAPQEGSKTRKELKAKLESLKEEQRTEILKKLDIQLNDDSYEGFININGLDGATAEEAEIKELCNRFLLQNRINTGDKATDKFLNSVIKGMPELVNIIGKKQHSI